MPTVKVNLSVPVTRTARVKQLESIFDVAPAKRSTFSKVCHVPHEAHDWNIGLIVGASGCGKSTIAREMFGDVLIDSFEWHSDRSLVESFPESMSIIDVTKLLSSVGFSSPPSWVRPFRCLSNGEQFRVTLARALAERPDLVAIDEFTSVVDRTVAQIGSAAIAKTIRARGGKFVAVACHYDIIDWLDPDWIYEPEQDRFQWRRERHGRPPIELTIRRVHPSAWQLFKHHHYLTGRLHNTAKCFVAFVGDRPAAFCSAISYPHPRRPSFREHRTVCLPDFQGVGIGNALSNYVASVYAARHLYRSTTSSPAMIGYRRRSPLWKMVRKPGITSPLTAGSKIQNTNKGTGSHRRVTAGFEYIGPKVTKPVADAFFAAEADEIANYVAAHPGSTIKHLIRRIGFSEGFIGRTLGELERAGRIRRHGKGTKQSPLAFFPPAAGVKELKSGKS